MCRGWKEAVGFSGISRAGRGRSCWRYLGQTQLELPQTQGLGLPSPGKPHEKRENPCSASLFPRNQARSTGENSRILLPTKPSGSSRNICSVHLFHLQPIPAGAIIPWIYVPFTIPVLSPSPSLFSIFYWNTKIPFSA